MLRICSEELFEEPGNMCMAAVHGSSCRLCCYGPGLGVHVRHICQIHVGGSGTAGRVVPTYWATFTDSEEAEVMEETLQLDTLSAQPPTPFLHKHCVDRHMQQHIELDL